MRTILALFALLVLAGVSFSQVPGPISSCTNISSAGTYTLTSDLSGAPIPIGIGPTSACIRIDVSNVVLDCAGHSITNPSAPGFTSIYGVFINQNSSNTVSGVTVKNCANIQNYTAHIYAQNLSNSLITNNVITGAYPNYGIRCDFGCSNNVIQSNVINGGYAGVDLLFGATNNLVDSMTMTGISSIAGVTIDGNGNNVTNSNIGCDNVFGWGIETYSGATNNRFEFNNITACDLGFYVPGDSNIIRNNRVFASSASSAAGYDIFGSSNLVTLNYAYNLTGNGFSISGAGTNLTNNTAFGDGSGFSVSGILANLNVAHDNGGDGFNVGDGTTVDSNLAYSNGGDGFSSTASSGSAFTSNTAHDNTLNGFHVQSTPGGIGEGGPFPPSPADSNQLSNNNAYNNHLQGFLVEDLYGAGSSGNDLTSDNATGNLGDGLQVYGQAGMTVDPSVFCGNTGNGVTVNATTDLNMSDLVTCNNTGHGLFVTGSSAIAALNVTSYGNNFSGINYDNTTASYILGSNAYSNNESGILLTGSSGILVNGNTLTSNPNGGIRLLGSAGNNLTFNTMNGNGNDGVHVDLSSPNTLILNNTASGNDPAAYSLLSGSDGCTMVNNTATGGVDGFAVATSNNVLANDTVSGASFYGFLLYSSASGNTLTNIAASSGGTGIDIFSPANTTTISTAHLFNNGQDFHVQGSGTVYNATDMRFDNPAGNMQNYTNLTLNDVLGAGEEYFVSWTSQPAALPIGKASFNRKFVTISTVSGSPSIDSVTWNYLASEVPPWVESGLQLWDYEGVWTARDVSPDTVNHRFVETSLSGFSVFAILVNNNVSVVKVDVTPLLPSPGGMTQWQINVTNTGAGPLDPVALTDILPAGLRYSSATPAPDSVSPDNLTVNWNNVGPLASGASAVILLNASVDANASNGTYFNSVNVTATPLNASDVTANDSTPIGIYAPGISVVKTLLNGTLQTLMPIPFSINVTNTGSINLSIDVLDTFESFNVSFNGSSVPPTQVTNSSVLWANYTVIQPGQSSVIYLNLTSINGKDYVNNVTVTGYPPNGNSVSDNSSAPFQVVFPIQPGRTPLPSQSLSASLESNCSGNAIVITSGGTPVEGASVVVNGNDTGSTDSSGQVTFQGCGQSLIVRASKSGYQDALIYPTEIACGQCVVACLNDSGCASDQRCQINQNVSLNQCVPLQCGCGQTADNHQCQGAVWQCGPGCNVCPSGQACNADHVCQPTGCTSNQQCPDNQQCLSPTGAPGSVQVPGSCQNVTGACGYVSNHAFVPYNYTCGPEPGCPSCPAGQNCVAHQCLSNDINCPSSVVVGASANCTLTQNNQACGPNDNCTAVITAPDGSNQTVSPDEAGNVLLGATLQGRYRIDLLKDGVLVKSVYVDVVPQSAPSGGGTQTAAGGPDLLTVAWLLVLLLVVVGAVIYWRSRGQKR